MVSVSSDPESDVLTTRPTRLVNFTFAVYSLDDVFVLCTVLIILTIIHFVAELTNYMQRTYMHTVSIRKAGLLVGPVQYNMRL